MQQVRQTPANWIHRREIAMTLVLVLMTMVSCAQTEQRIAVTSVTPAINTGMDYSSWLSDDLSNLVPNAWGATNNVYTDVTLQLSGAASISRLSLYDYQGDFTQYPDSFYAVNGTQKTYLGRFTGDQYMAWVDITLATPVLATAIVVHKYANCIPQKIKVYGFPQAVTTPVPVSTPGDTTWIRGKLPVEPKRWYQLNNVSDALPQLFDGITTSPVASAWGKVLGNYDAYYPLLPGEVMNIDSLKMFDFQGTNEWAPLKLYAIDSAWNRTLIATFTGSKYNEWVGPVPDAAGSNRFRLQSVVRNARYLVLNTSGAYPAELELYGSYHAPNALPALATKHIPLKQEIGVNAFEWDFEHPNNPLVIDESRMTAMKSFSSIRHYMDWEKLEQTDGSFTYNPTRSGGWNYDTMYARCKAEGIEVLACLKTIPAWLQQTYPTGQRDNENTPMAYGADPLLPASYIRQAKLAFQYAARYGSNAAVSSSLLSVNSTPRWTNDPVNTVKKGLNLIRYIECDNERDKWWKGRQAYQTGREYAANLSAFYDGHKGTLGTGVGVKAADPAMQVVMGGIASPSVDYVMGMIDWCKEFRGYRADGSVNLCWDVINYHFYPNDAHSAQGIGANRGAAPEVAGADSIATAFIQLAHTYAKDMPVWITETGYDVNQGSPLKAISIGSKSALQTQADWMLRNALLYARSGVERCFFYQTYDENIWNGGRFASSGLLNSDRSRKPAADFLFQARKAFGEFSFDTTLSRAPFVDRYKNGNQIAYALVKPSENGSSVNYTLNLGNASSARIYRPVAGQDSMSLQTVGLTNGQLSLAVTETPMFVLPMGGSNSSARMMKPDAQIAEIAAPVILFPNPANKVVNLQYGATGTAGTIFMRILDAAGRVAQATSFERAGEPFVKTLDIGGLRNGIYTIELRQGTEVIVKKLLKTE
jgi:endoglucanase